MINIVEYLKLTVLNQNCLYFLLIMQLDGLVNIVNISFSYTNRVLGC